MRAAAQRCSADGPGVGLHAWLGDRGGVQAREDIHPAAKMPSDVENTVAAIIITVFFLKLQAIQRGALGSCFLRAQTGCLYYGWT